MLSPVPLTDTPSLRRAMRARGRTRELKPWLRTTRTPARIAALRQAFAVGVA